MYDLFILLYNVLLRLIPICVVDLKLSLSRTIIRTRDFSPFIVTTMYEHDQVSACACAASISDAARTLTDKLVESHQIASRDPDNMLTNLRAIGMTIS